MSAVVQVQEYFRSVAETLASMGDHALWQAANLLTEVRIRNGTVWIVGNGGSAATASHFANDLRKMCNIKAISVPDLTPTVTAYGNDDGWDRMYSNPLALFHSVGDILVAISCSGGSQNVLRAAAMIGEDNLIVVTGRDNWRNQLAKFPCRSLIKVPTDDIRVVEDVHMVVCHAIAGIIRENR